MKQEIIITKWGVTDFEPEDIEKLKEIISGAEPFRVDIEVRKECANAQMYGRKDKIELRVECYMDDVDDGSLIDDALADIGKEVSDQDEWDCLCAYVWDAGIHTVIGGSLTISRDMDIEDVISKLGELYDDASSDLDKEYEILKSMVSDFVESWEAEKGE